MKFPIPETVLSDHIAVLGKTGSGKTSTEKLIIEHVVASGARVCILDTSKSDWWGITSSASGKSAGLPFKILGGPHGHVPLHSSAGKAIGHLVATRKLPLSIIDMADFEPGGIQRFFVDFAQSLWKDIRGVVYLVIEEAHEVAPKERAGFGAENMSIHWAKKLATGSRTKGVRLMVATQRAQALHNALLGSCETLIAHRVILDADQEQIIKWLRSQNKTLIPQVAESLSSLPDGTAWVCSGQAQFFQKVAFPKFKTYDNTKTPDIGDDESETEVKTAPVDQDELRSIIGEAVKEAEANDPKALKAEVSRLKADLQKAQRATAAGADPKAIEQAEQRGFDRAGNDLSAQIDSACRAANATIAKLRKGMDLATKFIVQIIAGAGEIDAATIQKALSDAAQQAAKTIEKQIERREAQTTKTRADGARIVETLKALLDDATTLDVLPRQPQFAISTPAVRPPSSQRTERNAPSSGNGSLSPTARKIVDVLEACYPVSLTYKSAARRAGASPRSSAFRGYEKEIIASGEVDIGDDGRLTAKRHGDAMIGDPIEAFAAKLQPSWAAMLRVVASAGAPLSREEIAAAAGISPTSSGLGTGLKELCSLALIQRLADGTYELAAEIRQAA